MEVPTRCPADGNFLVPWLTFQRYLRCFTCGGVFWWDGPSLYPARSSGEPDPRSKPSASGQLLGLWPDQIVRLSQL